jgi:hypothetical protein
MTWTLINRRAGYPNIEAPPLPAPASIALLPISPGFITSAVDDTYGGGEFVWARASAAIRQFGLVTLLPVWSPTTRTYTYNATEVANVANLGQPLGVAQYAMTVGQFGWFQIQGVTPISATATVAAGVTFGITAAGQVGANTAGKQVLGAVAVAPSTLAVVKTGATGRSGDTVINVGDVQGLFIGMALTGTGVGAGVIASIDPLNRYVVNSVANTADINGTSLTGTATGFIVALLNRSFAQGAIT